MSNPWEDRVKAVLELEEPIPQERPTSGSTKSATNPAESTVRAKKKEARSSSRAVRIKVENKTSTTVSIATNSARNRRVFIAPNAYVTFSPSDIATPVIAEELARLTQLDRIKVIDEAEEEKKAATFAEFDFVKFGPDGTLEQFDPERDPNLPFGMVVPPPNSDSSLTTVRLNGPKGEDVYVARNGMYCGVDTGRVISSRIAMRDLNKIKKGRGADS